MVKNGHLKKSPIAINNFDLAEITIMWMTGLIIIIINNHSQQIFMITDFNFSFTTFVSPQRKSVELLNSKNNC